MTRAPEQSVGEAILPTPAKTTRRGRRIESPETERLPIQAIEAVAALERLVILGHPGGGKSTLVNYLATQLARRRLGQIEADPPLPGWSPGTRPLPVRIVLRFFAAWLPAGAPRGRAGMVWDYLEQELAAQGQGEFFPVLKQTLYDEGGLIFFDGLDEVQEQDEAHKRSLIKEAIADFAALLGRCRVVVTCREYAYRPVQAQAPAYGWRLPEADFPVVELALFNEDQIESFATTWYRVIGPQKGWTEAKSQTEAANLVRAVNEVPHLRELAQYPLLLTLMAQVHGRDGTLPRDRADLYKRAVNLLLAQWENRIVRDTAGRHRVEPGLVMRLGAQTDTLLAVLERVAFDTHERQESRTDRSERAADIPREELRDVLAADLGSVDRADEVIAYIQERAGLLQARDNRTYAFPHRTFQEYLAAGYLMKQSDPDRLLRDRVRRDLTWWQEVFLLAAGATRDRPVLVKMLVDRLLPDDPGGQALPAEAHRQAQLAGQALHEASFGEHVRKEEADEPGPFARTYRQVQSRLETALRADEALSARERAAAGDVLARLGDDRPGVGVITGPRPDGLDGTALPDVEFCHIPAGPFWMGSPDKDERADDNEKPLHQVDLAYDFWLSRYPVTVAQFGAFIKAEGYQNPAYWPEAKQAGVWRAGQVKGRYDREPRVGPEGFGEPFNLPNHPVVGITWYEALAFCRWLEERMAHGEWANLPLSPAQRQDWTTIQSEVANLKSKITLPSEAEWEKAVRGGGGDRRRYPWDGELNPNKANYDETGLNGTSPVDCFPGGVSPFELEEMSGNVWEWTRSLYKAYPYEPDDGRENLAAGVDDVRVVRGGSFFNNLNYVRCAVRDWYVPDYGSSLNGFRVGVSPFTSDL